MLGLAAADFDSHVLSLPLALVLFCVPSIALCPLLEAELARATLLLSDAERARASLLSVNISVTIQVKHPEGNFKLAP